MKTRVISGIVLGILTVGLGIFGQISLGAVLALCSLIGYFEMTRALEVHRKGEKENALEISGVFWTLVLWMFLIVFSKLYGAEAFIALGTRVSLLGIMGIFSTNMTIYVLTFPKYHADQVAYSIFSFVYVPVLMSCIFRAKMLPYGIFIYALIFFCSWICDTFAYFVGRALGKHKMAPILSPHKTIEGAIGGVCGSVLLCVLTAVFIHYLYPEENLYWQFALIGVCGALLSMVGDLAASAIKRNHNIKDYGNCIPGHGGIMDRFDSTIFTAPIIYYLAAFLLTVIR